MPWMACGRQSEGKRMDILIGANERVLSMMRAFHGLQPQDMKLRPSRYNVEQPSRQGGMLLYNTLYNALVRLTEEEYRVYRAGEGAACCFTLAEQGLLVPLDWDELNAYLQGSEAYLLSPDRPLSITVTTTLECNAHCAYCYERGVRRRGLRGGVAEGLVPFILSRDASHGVKLTWFGGEPLMNVGLIDMVSEQLAAAGVSFTSFMITNGSLLTEELIASRHEAWHLTGAQITIDGPAGEYERIKCYGEGQGCDFAGILKRIEWLTQYQIQVQVRLNICRGNRRAIEDLVIDLDRNFHDNPYVQYYPAFLSGVEDRLTEEERHACVEELFQVVLDPDKLTGAGRFHSRPREVSCNYHDVRAYSIDVDGYVYRCERQVGLSEQALGRLDAPLELKDDRQGKVSEVLPASCHDCVFLPKCLGGCVIDRSQGMSPCFIEPYLIAAYLKLL